MQQPGHMYHFFAGASNFSIYGGRFGVHSSGTDSSIERLFQTTSPNALHNSGHIPDPQRCHPGTRTAVMQAIMNWFAGLEKETSMKRLAWVTGAAGAGKTAIARSICERCEEEQKLLGSFFFYSNDSTRNHPRSLIATICSQICSVDPEVRRSVINVIDNDPHIFDKSLKVQFQSLIIHPLSIIYEKGVRVGRLIVIDGLDECTSKASQRDILETLLYVIKTTYIPIRILVFSRPEIEITNFFNAEGIDALVFKIFLADEYSPDKDIELYLRNGFKEIRGRPIFKCLKIPMPWPSDDHISQLVRKASGQFIFAATVVRYVESSDHRPNQRLDAVLGLQHSFRDLPFSELDALYTHILSATNNPSLCTAILAFPAMYDGRLSVKSIERILQLEPGEVQLVISNIAAIAKIDDFLKCVSLLHKSLSDFLFDPYRAKELFVNRKEERLAHILRGIEIFSDRDSGFRFDFLDYDSLKFLNPVEVRMYFSSSSRAGMDIVNSLTKVPVESLCKKYFDNKERYPAEGQFLRTFLDVIKDLSPEVQMFQNSFHNHLQTFCHYALVYLETKFTDNWRGQGLYMNFQFTAFHLEDHPGMNSIEWDDEIAGLLSNLNAYENAVSQSFQRILSKSQRTRITSKAATYCIKYLCGIVRARREAYRHLRLTSIERQKRSSRPWFWHRRAPFHALDRKMVLLRESWMRDECILVKYGKLARRVRQQYPSFRVYPVCGWLTKQEKTLMAIIRDYSQTLTYPSFNWIHSKQEGFYFKNQAWFLYMVYLDYLPQILAASGPYEPLLQICKTKAFASMSMMFPDSSRKGRRAISAYLRRMEPKRNIEKF